LTREEARQLCKTDPILLGECLGYDLQEDVHRALFDALMSKSDKRLIPLWKVLYDGIPARIAKTCRLGAK
jgi:hypothetical protein